MFQRIFLKKSQFIVISDEKKAIKVAKNKTESAQPILEEKPIEKKKLSYNNFISLMHMKRLLFFILIFCFSLHHANAQIGGETAYQLLNLVDWPKRFLCRHYQLELSF